MAAPLPFGACNHKGQHKNRTVHNSGLNKKRATRLGGPLLWTTSLPISLAILFYPTLSHPIPPPLLTSPPHPRIMRALVARSPIGHTIPIRLAGADQHQRQHHQAENGYPQRILLGHRLPLFGANRAPTPNSPANRRSSPAVGPLWCLVTPQRVVGLTLPAFNGSRTVTPYPFTNLAAQRC